MACVVVECDMGHNAYIKIQDETEIKRVVKKHIELKETCKNLYEIAARGILGYSTHEPLTMEDLEVLIKNVKFRPIK